MIYMIYIFNHIDHHDPGHIVHGDGLYDLDRDIYDRYDLDRDGLYDLDHVVYGLDRDNLYIYIVMIYMIYTVQGSPSRCG